MDPTVAVITWMDQIFLKWLYELVILQLESCISDKIDYVNIPSMVHTFESSG